MMPPQDPNAPEGAAPPPEAGGMPPPAMTGMGGPPAVPQAGQAFEGTGGVPPELLAQLQNQMGMELPNS